MNDSSFHPTQQELLQAADGELSPSEHAAIRKHLEVCWDCRTRMAELEDTITRFVRLRRRKLDAQLPPLVGQRAELERLLQMKAAEMPEQGRGWLRNLASRIERVFPRPAWIGATAAVTIVLVVVNTVLTPSLSASVLIEKAVKAQHGSGVRYQTIEFHVGDHRWVRHVVRRPQKLESVEGLQPELAALSRSLSLQLDDPLSAPQFARWHDSLPHKTDAIEHVGGNLDLTTVNEGDGDIVRAHFVVRELDYWPVAVRLETRGGDRITIAEIAAGEAPHARAQKPAAALPGRMHEQALAPSMALHAQDLAQSELTVRVIMHQIGADMGEDLRIRADTKAVLVAGRVAIPERSEQIRRALSPVPWVRLDVRPFDSSPSHAAARMPVARVFVQNDPVVPLAEQLSSLIPNFDERSDFVNSVLASIETAVEHAWALQHLAERYDDKQLALLTPEANQMLDLLIQSHSSELKQELDGIDSRMSLILGPSHPASRLSFSNMSWQQFAKAASHSTRDLHEFLLKNLSGGNDAEGISDAEQAEQELRRHLADAKGTALSLQQSLSLPPNRSSSLK
jgi:hypothetical protein